MKTPWYWYLSFVVLILGNIVDGCATLYRMLHNPGAWKEASLVTLLTWDLLGLVPAVIFVKLFLFSLMLFAVWWFLSNSRLYGPWMGIRLSTFFGFFIGTLLALGGTGILDLFLRILLLFLPAEFTLAYWDVLPTVFWVAVMLFGGAAMGGATAVLFVFDNRRLANEE